MIRPQEESTAKDVPYRRFMNHAGVHERFAAEWHTARALVPVIAVVAVVLAVLLDPAAWWRMTLLAVPVLMYVAWYRWRIPIVPLAVVVIGTVCAAQWTGALELSMFLVALLALAAGGWERNAILAWAVVIAAVATPPVLAVVQLGDQLAWPNWMAGIAFPAVLGWTVRRQEQLAVELAAARSELAARAILDERRRIARDVHDLVGHGLAAVLLQITSARHVLRRNPDSADEALRTAEETGRRSLQDLRRTVGLMRGEGDPYDTASLPNLTHIADLVDSFRVAGIAVVYDASGDGSAVDSSVALTAYRIAQESLSNVSRYASHARTSVKVLVDDTAVRLDVLSVGPVDGVPQGSGRQRFGLDGMRERADMVGGAVSAGPTDDGWLVSARLPRVSHSRGSVPKSSEVHDR